MSVNTSPAPARTDTAATPAPPVDPTRSVRLGGIAMAAGAAAWALGTVLNYDIDPVDGEYPLAYKASSLLFQLGLVALVAVQLRTRATGTGRLARGFLHAEHVMLGLAITATVLWALVPSRHDTALFLALDAFWPLSMIGMFAIGIRIAIAGRWRGLARFWPLGAESWAPVVIPVAAVLSGAATYVSAGHLLLGYAALGLVLTLRPELTGAR